MAEFGEGPKDRPEDPGRRFVLKAGILGGLGLIASKLLGQDKRILEAASQSIPTPRPALPTPPNPNQENIDRKNQDQEITALRNAIENKLVGRNIAELVVAPADATGETVTYKISETRGMKVRTFPEVSVTKDNETGKSFSYKEEFKVRSLVSYRVGQKEWEWGAVLLTDMDANPQAKPDNLDSSLKAETSLYVFVCLKEDDIRYAQRKD
jgi:hypothetical protein